MNSIIKYWDENLVEKHIASEIEWLFTYLDNNNITELSYIDIGSNVGKFYDLISEKYIIKKSIMIEPSKILFDYMVEKYLEKDNIEIFNFAISDTEGKFKFEDSALNAVELYNERGVDYSINLGLSKLNRKTMGETLCYSMDYFLRNICSLSPNEIVFIKIDTENSDLFIIKSMTNFFIEHNITPFILFENNYHNDLSTSDAIDIINNFCNLCQYEPVELTVSGDKYIKAKFKK